MDINTVYSQIFKIWRKKRMDQFEELIQPNEDDVVLDVGGYPRTWTDRPQLAKKIDCLNIHPIVWDALSFPNHNVSTMIGDGCQLQYTDNSYSILFSNSVIEHVGDWDRQQAFASEVRRVGKKLWVQTPAFECPWEPHFLAPFVHWFPVKIRRRILRWFTLWGWLVKPSQKRIDDTIAYTCLLTKKQMKELFPDCTIMTERLFGIFPKSYIAYRITD